MRATVRNIHRFVLGACLGLGQCGSGELAGMCGDICGGLGCGDGVSYAPCKRSCITRMDSAEGRSEDCAAAYSVLLECLVALDSCGDIGTRDSRKGGDLEYPCRADSELFLDACGELWFADRRSE